MKNLRWILLLSILVCSGVVIFQNLEPARFELLFASVELPLAALLSVALLVGFLTGLLTPTLWRVRGWRTNNGKRKPKRNPPPAEVDATETF